MQNFPNKKLVHTVAWSLKGHSNENFDLQLFSFIESTDQGVKVKLFSTFLVRIWPSYSNFSKSPWGLILQGGNLPGVTDPASQSPGDQI